MDYVYSPANSIDTIVKEPEISLPPSREVSGYAKTSTTLAELDAFEEEYVDEEPLKYEELPREVKIQVDAADAAKFPKEENKRLNSLSENANNHSASDKGQGVLANLATAYVEILDEILFVNNLEDLKKIFAKEDRMIALGIFLVIMSVIMMVL